MTTYRKIATIEATQWFKMGDHPAVVMKSDPNHYAAIGIPWCPTMEGGHVVTPGDWIATGIKGEHWPIKPDVFAETYVAVSALDAAEGRATVTGDRSEIDRIAAILRTGQHGSHVSNAAADWIERLASAEFEAVQRLNAITAPSDKIAEAVREARGLMHDIMCLPDDAKMNVARVWAASARAALSALETP